ncbi:MAG TPA: hypothetical protein VEZ48_13585 [Sphingomonadaceae bacterium]|jgi:hypothetical protein|nr:hypothetical protein [Sphingomonadaceae bacterium]
MPPSLKALIGLAATVLSAWLFHGPAGYGQRLIGKLDAHVQQVVAKQELKTVTARFPRPLSRDLRFSGEANSFQRQRFVEIIQDEEIRGLRSVGWDRTPAPSAAPAAASANGDAR